MDLGAITYGGTGGHKERAAKKIIGRNAGAGPSTTAAIPSTTAAKRSPLRHFSSVSANG